MIRFPIPTLCAALLSLLAAVPAAAQTTENTFASTTDNYGIAPIAYGSRRQSLETSVTLPTTLIGSTVRSAHAVKQSFIGLFGVTTEASAILMSLTARRDVVGFSPNGLVFRNSSFGTFQVRIGGLTVVSQAAVNTPILGTFVGNAFVGPVPRLDVSLFGIGFRLAGGATARADWNITQSISFASGVSVAFNGPMRGRATGLASASINVLGVSVGVSSTLVYADTNANMSVSITPTSTVGSIAWTVQEIRLRLLVWATIAGVTNTQALIDYATPAKSGIAVLR